MKTDSATSDFSLSLILKQPHSLVPLSIKRFVCLLFSQFILCVILQIGDLQSSHSSITNSLEGYPDHSDSKDVLNQLKEDFAALWKVDKPCKWFHSVILYMTETAERMNF